jgi:hypothetical protein
LCQIASEKDVWLWDPDDRKNLSELEIERFFAAIWKPHGTAPTRNLGGINFTFVRVTLSLTRRWHGIGFKMGLMRP